MAKTLVYRKPQKVQYLEDVVLSSCKTNHEPPQPELDRPQPPAPPALEMKESVKKERKFKTCEKE